jgi:hypothetical protein
MPVYNYFLVLFLKFLLNCILNANSSSFHYEYLKESEFDGLKTYEFGIPDDIFSNSTLNPDNDGFCSDDCLGNGVFRLHKCQNGANIHELKSYFLNILIISYYNYRDTGCHVATSFYECR